MDIPKHTLGLAGEYAVATELCRRGVYAQLTLGNWKRTDLLVESHRRLLRVQVKAKQGRDWPGIRGIHGDDIVLVFVDYQHKSLMDRPDFYILNADDWKRAVKKEMIDAGLVQRGEVSLDDEYVPTWKNGFVGWSVPASNLIPFKEAWERFPSSGASG